MTKFKRFIKINFIKRNYLYDSIKICRYRLVVRTPGFHPGNRGSIPRSGTKIKKGFEFFSKPFFILVESYFTVNELRIKKAVLI